MERGFNAGQKHKEYTIYLQPFTSYSEILVGNSNFSYPFAFRGVFIEIPGKSFVLRKLESWGYQAVKTV